MHQTNKWENLLLNDTMTNTKNLQKNVIFTNANQVEHYDLSLNITNNPKWKMKNMHHLDMTSCNKLVN
jgi:hypothetical protein